jgi:hypothetical protein
MNSSINDLFSKYGSKGLEYLSPFLKKAGDLTPTQIASALKSVNPDLPFKKGGKVPKAGRKAKKSKGKKKK